MKKYKIIVWGPGAMGQAALRELIRRNEFEVVGVLAYSPEKHGMDVGELLGSGPVGIKMTTDKEEIYETKADCVVFTGMFTPTDELQELQNQEIIRLLESGKNVCTPCSYFYPHGQGEAYAKRFEDACTKGGTSLHGSGENPGFWLERVGLTLTGICNDVEYITLDEYADLSVANDNTTFTSVGFGMKPEEAKPIHNALMMFWKKNHFNETLQFMSKALFGRHLDRVEIEPEMQTAEEQIVFDKQQGDPIDFVIEEGGIYGMTFNCKGILDDQVVLRDSVNWFLTDRASPFKGKKDSTWEIEIEGKPNSIKCSFQTMASARNNLQFYPGDPTTPTWYVTIAAVIQTIPVVCEHAPGIVYPSMFTNHVPDLRNLAARSSVVN